MSIAFTLSWGYNDNNEAVNHIWKHFRGEEFSEEDITVQAQSEQNPVPRSYNNWLI